MITFSPDGTTIATAEILSEGEKAIRLWDAKTGNHHTTFANLINPEEKRRLPILSVAFSPDGKTLASTDGSRDIQLWDIDTGKTQNYAPFSRRPRLLCRRFCCSHIFTRWHDVK